MLVKANVCIRLYKSYRLYFLQKKTLIYKYIPEDAKKLFSAAFSEMEPLAAGAFTHSAVTSWEVLPANTSFSWVVLPARTSTSSNSLIPTLWEHGTVLSAAPRLPSEIPKAPLEPVSETLTAVSLQLSISTFISSEADSIISAFSICSEPALKS